MRTEQLPSPGRPATADLVLGRYRLQRVLGAGAFATVWSAHDERLERDVAVKLIDRERVVFERFRREARAAARLTHPAIVTLYEAAIDEHGAYLVSELVHGRGLDRQLAAGRCSDRDVLEISIALARALAYAHCEGVVHRDVKPSNVLVPVSHRTEDGTAAKLTDFGVARLLDDGRDLLTRTGDVIGTAAYMAPEQASGREATAAADLYSLAVVTYEALTGVNPLRGRAAVPRSSRRQAVYLPPVRRQRRDLPDPLARALDRALSPRPAERGSVDELRDALESSVPEVAATPGVVAPRGWLRARQSTAEEADEQPPRNRVWADAEPRAAGTPAGGTRNQRLLRVANAALSAFVVWWLSLHLLSTPPLAPLAAAAAALVVTMLAPRLGFLVIAAVIVGLAAWQGRPGAATVLALVAWLTIVAMPVRGALWGLPGGAVLLGACSLAGAWPAVAARSGARLWLRAAAAGAGFIWLAAAGAFAGAPLYERVRPAPPPAAVWTRSPELTVHNVLAATVHSGVLGGALVWAFAAAVGPLIVVRGRSPVLTAALALLWAGLTAGATVFTMRALARGHALADPRGIVLGALAGAALIAAPLLWSRAHSLGVARDVP
jgi:eukaryotic-like serine/threonine-protein kinase